MNVKASNLTIESLLNKGKYEIPDYQRDYDWDNNNIKELLEDIEELGPQENYFIGNMVFEGNFDGPIFSVVDGQQRITTVIIILSAIRDNFLRLNEDNLAMGIHGNYITCRDRDNKEFFRLQSKSAYPTLEARILHKDKDMSIEPKSNCEKHILSAYDYITSHIQTFSVDKLKELRDKILKLEIVFVAAETVTDASTIFMTINAKGKDLTTLDLVKNLIFSKYPRRTGINEPADSWKVLMGTVGSYSKFLIHCYSSRYKRVSETKLYKEIEKTIVELGKPNGNGTEVFLNQLKTDATTYLKIIDPENYKWTNNDYDIKTSIVAIVKTFKIEVAHSFLVALLRDYDSRKISKAMLLRILKAIERFHFINNAICSNRSSGLDLYYAGKAKELYSKQLKSEKHIVLQNMETELGQKVAKQSEFESAFDSKLYYLDNESKQKSLVQYVLNLIERKENKNSILMNPSIEHITPQTPQGSGTPNLDLIKNMGNLVLLEQNINSNIGNKPYDEKKKEILKNSSVKTTKKVFKSNTTWGPDEINKRNQELKSYLYSSVWQ